MCFVRLLCIRDGFIRDGCIGSRKVDRQCRLGEVMRVGGHVVVLRFDNGKSLLKSRSCVCTIRLVGRKMSFLRNVLKEVRSS